MLTRLSAAALAFAAPIAFFPTHSVQAQPAFAAPRVDHLRAGPFVLTVFEGAPPTSSNAKNSLSRGIRLYERPRRSIFAAVAAQEIFEMEYKSRSGPYADKRQMEIISHEIESLIASRHGGFDLAAFEAKEADALTGYRQFRGASQAQILAEMRRARPVAERWLAANRHVVQTLLAYRFPRRR